MIKMKDLESIPEELEKLADFFTGFILDQNEFSDSDLEAAQKLSDIAENLSDLLFLKQEEIEDLRYENQLLKKKLLSTQKEL